MNISEKSEKSEKSNNIIQDDIFQNKTSIINYIQDILIFSNQDCGKIYNELPKEIKLDIGDQTSKYICKLVENSRINNNYASLRNTKQGGQASAGDEDLKRVAEEQQRNNILNKIIGGGKRRKKSKKKKGKSKRKRSKTRRRR